MSLVDNFCLLGFNLGMPEMIIFAGILLLLFGSAKLPSLMRNMGRSVNEFKAGIHEKPADVTAVEENREQEMDKVTKV